MTQAEPQNPAERLVWRALVWTWPIYAIGALYVVGPVLGWSLAGLAALALYLGPTIRPDLRATGPVPALAWLWMAGMLLMLFALWAGHLDWGLGLGKTIKSSIGWAKGWALIPLFILAGAVLPIRREVLVRGQCRLGLWTLCLAPPLLAAPYLGLPSQIFTSPLKAVGGPGPEYFSVYLYTIDPASWTPRWQFFAPWSPFAALLGVCMVLFALEERHRGWMAVGLSAGILMIFASKSRMGLVGLVACTLGPRLLPLVARSVGWFLVSAVATASAAWGSAAIDLGNQALQNSNRPAPTAPVCAKPCNASPMNAGSPTRCFLVTERFSPVHIWSNTCPSEVTTPGTVFYSSRASPASWRFLSPSPCISAW